MLQRCTPNTHREGVDVVLIERVAVVPPRHARLLLLQRRGLRRGKGRGWAARTGGGRSPTSYVTVATNCYALPLSLCRCCLLDEVGLEFRICSGALILISCSLVVPSWPVRFCACWRAADRWGWLGSRVARQGGTEWMVSGSKRSGIHWTVCRTRKLSRLSTGTFF